ncbi:Cold-responsive protein kinase 1 [Bienertia sinuspersici]
MPPNATHVSTRVAGTSILAYKHAFGLSSSMIAAVLFQRLPSSRVCCKGAIDSKSRLYSFGVLLVEIVSGRCNTNMRLPMERKFLLERTWESYQRKELVWLVDESLEGLYDAEEACRFLKIGLLCTQDAPKLRPAMSTRGEDADERNEHR